MTSPEWIAQAQQRCDAATPGPWTEEREQDGDESGYYASSYATGKVWGPHAPVPPGGELDYDIDDDTVLTAELDHDAEFVVTARTDLPRALSVLTAVLDIHRRRRAQHAHHADWCEADGRPWPCATVRAITEAR